MVNENGLITEDLTPDRWADLAHLFGRNGANSGCWCMWWRLSAKDWSAGGNDANRDAFEAIVAGGEQTGVLAYDEDRPVGWCAVAPREAYPRILRSPTLGPFDRDEAGIWAVTCFFINRYHRRAGVGRALLAAAVDRARRGGARAVEGYPVETLGERRSSGDLFTGTVSQFTQAGFTVHRRPTGRRLVMRLEL
jgi:GNAT superfamily N-acetyltransferase